MTYRYRIYPSLEQEARMVSWLETCRRVYNHALRERKDWLGSRKCRMDRCSLRAEYVISADTPYPGYYPQQNALTFAEDLDFRIMAKGFLGKHTLDAGPGQFLNQVLPWVCFKRGVYYGKVDPYGTSQECPDCGARVKKDLSVRIHECHECGSVKPRDVASGQVIKARGLSVFKLQVDGIYRGIRKLVLDKTERSLKFSRAILRSPRCMRKHQRREKSRQVRVKCISV